MKIRTMLATLAFGVSAVAVNAQNSGDPPTYVQRPQPQDAPGGNLPGRGMAAHRPPSPSLLMLALDLNHDGVIDADEIAKASAALKTLDKNGDGKLTPDELQPLPSEKRDSSSASIDPRPPQGAHIVSPGRPGIDGQLQAAMDPLMLALDENGDGVIDADEMANAPAALKTLDINDDGKLTPDELRPVLPDEPGGSVASDGQRPAPPSGLMLALDVNHDGVIDSEEIANAPAELKTLDKNGDGKLTPDELRLPRRNRLGRGARAPGLNGRRPSPPSLLMLALDVNHDGVIDADEITNASAALKTLDKNGDGKLTPDELRPPRNGGLELGNDAPPPTSTVGVNTP
jgi:Ca2+-binding EF-hand superfamily protein